MSSPKDHLWSAIRAPRRRLHAFDRGSLTEALRAGGGSAGAAVVYDAFAGEKVGDAAAAGARHRVIGRQHQES